MQRIHFRLFVLLFSVLSVFIFSSPEKLIIAPSSPSSHELKNRILKTLLQIPPLRFEANQGKTYSQVKFLSRANGYTLFVTSQETVFALPV